MSQIVSTKNHERHGITLHLHTFVKQKKKTQNRGAQDETERRHYKIF